MLKRLQYLFLADNSITAIEGLEGLDSLLVLDLRNNRIDHLHGAYLPDSVKYVFLEGNPCVKMEGYREVGDPFSHS